MQKNKAKRDKTMAEKQKKEKAMLLEKLKQMPIVHIALNQTGIGRTTYYRWRDEDLQFKKEADAAIVEGETFITELSESKLVSLINKESFPAVQLWLKSHHPKYASKLELSGTLEQPRDEMAEEDWETLGRVLRMLNLPLPPDMQTKINNQTN